jgi:hypothetical protein
MMVEAAESECGVLRDVDRLDHPRDRRLRVPRLVGRVAAASALTDALILIHKRKSPRHRLPKGSQEDLTMQDYINAALQIKIDGLTPRLATVERNGQTLPCIEYDGEPKSWMAAALVSKRQQVISIFDGGRYCFFGDGRPVAPLASASPNKSTPPRRHVALTAQELLNRAGIYLDSYAPRDYDYTCPRCSANRKPHHQKTRCLGVKIDARKVMWHCGHCGWSGPEKGSAPSNGQGDEIAATYDYIGFQKVRYPKDHDPRFRVRHRDGGGWKWGAGGADTKVLYRKDEINEAISLERTILIVEGEKDADNSWRIGIPATCNAQGASEPGKKPNWKAEHSQQLRDADIVVIPDHDPPGYAHAEAICRTSLGIAKRVRRLVLAKHWPECPVGGDVSDWLAAGHTREELDALIEQAQDYEQPQPQPQQPEEPPPPEPPPPEQVEQASQNAQEEELEIWDAGDDPGPIPPREWLLANQFCLGFISSIVGAGGTGKTALRIVQYISMAIGRSLTGEHVFRRARVLLICLEDNRREIERRIKAALDHHHVDRSELKGWLFVTCPKRSKLAELKKRMRVLGPLERQIRKAVELLKPDVVALDPFRKAHALEENNSGDMDYVCDLLADMADQFNIAPDIPHHVHKGQIEPGDADAGRGSSGVKDAGRLTYTLTFMSEEAAKLYGVPVETRRDYIRLDTAKVNIVRHSTNPTWFKLVGVPLGNATPEYPNGDTVQTVESWNPPDIWIDLSPQTINVILNEIARGLDNGQRYSAAASAKHRAAWRIVQRHYPAKTDDQCREIIKAWLKTGLLFSDKYDDPVNRKEFDGLFVDDAKRPSGFAQ